MSNLALYDHAKEAIAAAVNFDEVTRLRTEAEKAQAYARIVRDRKMQADMAELVARAERKLGILLRKAKDDGLLSQGGRPAERSNVSEPETGTDEAPVFNSTPFTLSDIGVDKKMSARAQRAAELAEDAFEQSVREKREKILAATAAVVSAPKAKAAAPKVAPTKPLDARRFHQFAFSVLALSVSSDRVGSKAILFMARECGLLGQGEDNLDFTPEAAIAMGTIASVALKAAGIEDKNTPEGSGTAREASGGQPLPSNGDIGDLQDGTQSAPQPLSREEQDQRIRDGYAVNEKLAAICAAVGLSPNVVKGRARRMDLSDPDRQRKAASANMRAINAAKGEAS